MTNNQSKLSKKSGNPRYNFKKLSLKTRIEIIRKRYLIRKAKQLLNQGMETPQPASFQDDYEKTISIEVLAEILERNRNYEKTEELLKHHDDDKSDNSDKSDKYDSDNFESDSDNDDKETSKNTEDTVSPENERNLLVEEVPEIIEL